MAQPRIRVFSSCYHAGGYQLLNYKIKLVMTFNWRKMWSADYKPNLSQRTLQEIKLQDNVFHWPLKKIDCVYNFG